MKNARKSNKKSTLKKLKIDSKKLFCLQFFGDPNRILSRKKFCFEAEYKL